ncbi:MAG: hypothetical protein HY744_15750 [Deltaproteobacteria bacterium]|nr:hypothetical protein [Deltaproteobacteria bacterium]
MSPLARRWLALFPALAEHELRTQFARSELYAGAARELAPALDRLCQMAEQGDAAAREALGAFVPTVADPGHLEQLGPLREAALATPLPSLGRLLRCATAAHHFASSDEELAGGEGVPTRDGRPLTLGERRALARAPSRAALRKLMRDPHPLVVRRLLGNPKITEHDVVEMAARRPAVPEVATEIAKAWWRSARVRLAVVLNPGSPPGVSVPLLALLLRHELEQVVGAIDLPVVVRATAGELLVLRPPPRPTEVPETKH